MAQDLLHQRSYLLHVGARQVVNLYRGDDLTLACGILHFLNQSAQLLQLGPGGPDNYAVADSIGRSRRSLSLIAGLVKKLKHVNQLNSFGMFQLYDYRPGTGTGNVQLCN